VNQQIYVNGVLREWWDDSSRTYKAFNSSGVQTSSRPYTPQENSAADASAQKANLTSTEDSLMVQLSNGIAAIQAARTAANNDVAVADSLAASANSLSAQVSSRITAVAGWTPSATYSAADLNAIKSELAGILDKQKQIIDALSAFYAYRKAVDQNAVTTDDAILWLARLVSNTLS
jgi:hypothetical protein